MRALLIGLSLAATALAAPVLALERSQPLHEQCSTVESADFSLIDTSFDVLVPTNPSEPVLQYAVVRYYLMPEPPLLQPAYFARLNSEHSEFDPLLIPASQFRIRAFRDEMRERFGELNYTMT